MKKVRKDSFFLKILTYSIMIFVSLWFFLPFAWMISVSLKPSGQVYEYPPRLIPSPATFENYFTAWEKASFSRYFLNTTIFAVVGTCATLILCSLGGYVFAKLKFPGRNLLFVVVLSTMMLPFFSVLVPLFLIVKNLGLINTFAGLVLPGVVNGYFIFLFRQFFSMLPDDLIEAARIDGCSEFRIFLQVILPLAKPALATVAIFGFMNRWNALVWPLVVLTDPDKRTLQVGLAIFQGEQLTGAQWNELMAASVISLLPTVVVFLLAQKYFTTGIALTGIKE
ncbi:carbohydrate ABC transporter permease [Thermatribacter velox]|uniref:Carbohydrate ABC transporter permease n=1 Tax=Thermatribacter velox TaxID=3039681 RepID=A0ABZ2YEY9_9BACT